MIGAPAAVGSVPAASLSNQLASLSPAVCADIHAPFGAVAPLHYPSLRAG